MEYLGHVLSTNGVQPRPFNYSSDSISSTTKSRGCQTIRASREYSRKFAEAFGSIMVPLARLLKKDEEWRWTEDQQFAFERVKAVLTSKPLVAYPNFEQPFCLVTGASKIGLGICLMEDQGRGCQSIAPELAWRLHRWSLTLQEYEFEIVYRAGATNVVADAPSLAPVAVLIATGRRPRRQDEQEAGHESLVEQATWCQRRMNWIRMMDEAALTWGLQVMVVKLLRHQPKQADKALPGKPAAVDDRRRASRPIGQESVFDDEIEAEPTLQATYDEIIAAQRRSKLVQKLLAEGDYRGAKIEKMYRLVIIQTPCSLATRAMGDSI
ncbi:unnamed protein product [Phytophthora fragariaefolia]|uniref:Unnamed protein product n=1 Tax=Phytophthora fragariaefolia TaxID=1490495 RepID=A0A9W7DBP5_9STRA|nr:unnamed protein product [Phytophthora fragariaefolia]